MYGPKSGKKIEEVSRTRKSKKKVCPSTLGDKKEGETMGFKSRKDDRALKMGRGLSSAKRPS